MQAAVAPAPSPPRRMARNVGRVPGAAGGMFKGSQVDPNDRWASIAVSPDQWLTWRQPVLVARMREQWSNNDHVKRYVDMCRQNIVGPLGILLQAKAKKRGGQLDTESNDAIEAWWAQWGRTGHCDVTGTYSWREIQDVCVATCVRDGEFLARKIYGKHAGPMGFSLQLIDPARLPIRYEALKWGDEGGFVRQGIEFNRYGRPVAYHFSSLDERDAYYYTLNGKGYVRVPAEEVIHVFKKEMVGQRRGLPWAATSLFGLHHLQGFQDAAVQNARASAAKMGFFEWDAGMGPDCDGDDEGEIYVDAEPLSFHELPPGARLKDWNPTYPSGEYAVFAKQVLRSIAAGMNVSYHSLTGDLEKVNFSSIRSGTLEERERWKQDQQFVIEQLCTPVFEEALKLALLAGRITVRGRPLSAEKYAEYRKVSWQGRRWAWVDPRADVESALSSIRGGLTSVSQVIREQGRDPQEVFRELAEDLVAMREAGLPEAFITQVLIGKVTGGNAPPANDENDEDNDHADAA
ncbi:phage portal protein [Dyella sp. M7H15-1]|nr:phage portal protein [Dyella sp. M7H15-1]